jgi:hypothetical protein
MPRLIIKGTIVNIPDSAASPNWSPAIIQGFEVLADAVNAVTGSFDVAPQVQNIDANNNSSDITLNNLVFPPSEVRAATVYYTVARSTNDSGPPDGQNLTEAGTIEISYNSSRPTNEKWELVRTGQGDALITFEITDLGQITFTTSPLTGVDHTGIISYRAISILND